MQACVPCESITTPQKLVENSAPVSQYLDSLYKTEFKNVFSDVTKEAGIALMTTKKAWGPILVRPHSSDSFVVVRRVCVNKKTVIEEKYFTIQHHTPNGSLSGYIFKTGAGEGITAGVMTFQSPQIVLKWALANARNIHGELAKTYKVT